MKYLLAPAVALLGRMRFVQKFILLGLVLVVPLGAVSFAYASEQHAAVSSTAAEQSGMAAIEPLLRLAEDLAAARHIAAVTGRSAAVPAGDLAAVDAADRRAGSALGSSGNWAELRQQLLLAGTTSGRATALAAYDGASIALQKLLIQVGNAAGLSVDPELAVSDLFDLVDVRIPLLLDSSTRIVDQLATQSGTALTPNARVEVLSAVGVSLGAIDSTTTFLDQAVGDAVARTAAETGSGSLRAPIDELDGAVSRLDQALRDVELFHAPLGSSGVTAQSVVGGANRLDDRRHTGRRQAAPEPHRTIFRARAAGGDPGRHDVPDRDLPVHRLLLRVRGRDPQHGHDAAGVRRGALHRARGDHQPRRARVCRRGDQ